MRHLHTWLGRATGAALALTMAAHAAQAACEPARVAAKYPAVAGHTIKIGQDGESPPFSFRDPANFDHLIGLDADTARAVFACAGVPVTFKTGAWSGLIPAAMSSQIDVMWDTLLYTPERAKRLDFVYYMKSATGIIVAKGNPKNIHSFADICGLRGTANLGTTQEAMLRDADKACTAAGKPSVEIALTPDMPGGLRQVQNDRADLFPLNKFVGDTMVSRFPNVEMGFTIVTGAKIAAATAKGNPDLVRLIEDGLSTLEENGELRRIYDRYGVDYDLVVKPEVLTQ